MRDIEIESVTVVPSPKVSLDRALWGAVKAYMADSREGVDVLLKIDDREYKINRWTIVEGLRGSFR